MPFLEKYLMVKRSKLPGAGKGLFTKVPIAKGMRIVEYTGEILTWKEVEKMTEERNGYVFYVNSKHVIDAWNAKKALARYANDAKGIARVEGIRNNAEYVVEKKRCYIDAAKNIEAGAEILVGYGAEYWQVIRYNIRLEEKKKKTGKTKAILPHHQLAKRSTRKKY
jgi:SET domain-containing protein